MEYIITEQMREWGKANGYNVDLHHEFFMDYIANKTGKPYKDLDAAFRNCCRADWGGLRKAQTRWQPPAHISTVTHRDTYIPIPKEGEKMPDNLMQFVRGRK